MSFTQLDKQIADCTTACNKEGFSVSELINELQKIPNQNAKVYRESCGYTYPVQLVLYGPDGNIHLL